MKDNRFSFIIPHSSFSSAFLNLKTKLRARAPCASRRAEAVLEILTPRQVVHVTEETKTARFGKRQSVVHARIRFAQAPKAIDVCAEGLRVEERREIVARRGEIEVDQPAPAQTFGGDERELMIGDDERAQDAINARHALVCIRESVSREEIERARGRCIQTQLDAAREAPACVQEAAEETTERIACAAHVAEANHFLQTCVEVSGRRAHAVGGEGLIESGIEGEGAFRTQARIAKRAETTGEERRAEAFKQRRRAITVADVTAQFCAGRTKQISD